MYSLLPLLLKQEVWPAILHLSILSHPTVSLRLAYWSWTVPILSYQHCCTFRIFSWTFPQLVSEINTISVYVSVIKTLKSKQLKRIFLYLEYQL